MSQLEIARQCGRRQIASKLRQKCAQRSQTVTARIDVFAEFVAGKVLPDTRTPLAAPLPDRRRCSRSACHFSTATLTRRPPAANNDCSCVNVAARWVFACLRVLF